MARPARRVQTVLDSPSLQLAGEYARGLLECIRSDDEAEQAAAELESVTRILAEADGVGYLLTQLQTSTSEAVEFVTRTFAGRVSQRLEALLAVMARNGRLGLLAGVARRFRQLLNEREGKVEVTVTTAVTLAEPIREKIAAELTEILKAEPILVSRVDPAIVGGLRMQIGDRLFDASVASDLARLRERLLVRGRMK